MICCKDCKHYSENQEITRVVQSCGAPQIPVIAKLIIGDAPGVEKAQIDCMHIRFNGDLCGSVGRWFEVR